MTCWLLTANELYFICNALKQGFQRLSPVCKACLPAFWRVSAHSGRVGTDYPT
jgi:hypothetical protein